MIQKASPSTVVLQCTAEQKKSYMKASAGQPLGAWCLASLDAAAASQPDWPDRFLLADGLSDELYIVHLQAPRCIARFAENFDLDCWESKEVMWIDAPPVDAMAGARLMQEMGDALIELLERE